MAKLNQPIDRNPRVLIQSIVFFFFGIYFACYGISGCGVESTLCLQSRAAEEASERAKQEKLAAAVENYVLAEEKYKKVAELKNVVAAELEARRAEAHTLRLAYVQKYGREG